MKKGKLFSILTMLLSASLLFGSVTAYAEPTDVAETTKAITKEAVETSTEEELLTTDDGILMEGQQLTELDEYENYESLLEEPEIEEAPMTFSANPDLSGIVDSKGKYNGYDVYYADDAAEYCIQLIKDHVETIDKSFIIAVQYSVSEVGSGSPYQYAADVYAEEFTKAFNDSLFVDGKGGDYILYSMYGRPFYVTTSCKCFTSTTNPDVGVALVYATPGKAYYYTTASQEKTFTTKVQSVLSSLKLSGKSDYDKVCAIFDYICANVEYDYTNLNKSGYYTMYTAYAALCEGTAVCQGYSNLFYYMCNEAGVPCRIVAGTGKTSTGSGAHAWNIVKLGDKWYHVDSTWGSSYSQWYSGRYFFLQSTYNFVNGHNGTSHIMDYMTGIQYIDYTSNEFKAAYPISETADYCGEHDYVLVDSRKASCDVTGYEVYKCSKCGETYEETYAALHHKYVTESETAPTCIKAGVRLEKCMYCGKEKTEAVPATGHDYEVIEKVEAGCVNDGHTTYECKVCGHIYTGDIVPSFGGHDYQLDETKSVTMTHEEDGLDVYVCSVCGDSYEDIYKSIPNHVYDDFDIMGLTESCGYDLSAICTICGEEEFILSDLHDMEPYTYTDSKGEEHKNYKCCKYCGLVLDSDGNPIKDDDSFVYKEVNPSCTSHKEVTINAKEADCLSQGYDEFVRCENCGKIISGAPNFTLPVGHTWRTMEIEPTCTENGHKYTYCEVCHELSEHVLMSATGHTLVTEYGTEPTCTEDGTTDYIYCSECGFVEEEADIIPAFGHTFIEDIVEATCTVDGYYTGIYCATCGYVDEEGYIIEATGHDFVTISKEIPKTCYEDGKKAYIVCEKCGEVESDGAVIPAGHDLIYWAYSAPTEYEDGNIECWYCPNCDTFFLDEAATQPTTFNDIVLKYEDKEDSGKTDDGDNDNGNTGDNNNNTESGNKNSGTDENSDNKGVTKDANLVSTDDGNTEATQVSTPQTVTSTVVESDGTDGTVSDVSPSSSANTGDTNIPLIILIIVIIAILVVILVIAMRTKPNKKDDNKPDDKKE